MTTTINLLKYGIGAAFLAPFFPAILLMWSCRWIHMNAGFEECSEASGKRRTFGDVIFANMLQSAQGCKSQRFCETVE